MKSVSRPDNPELHVSIIFIWEYYYESKLWCKYRWEKLSEYDETAINCLCPPTFHFCLKILYFIVSERDALFCVIPTLFRLLFTEMPAFNMLKIGANKGLNSVPETDRVHWDALSGDVRSCWCQVSFKLAEPVLSICCNFTKTKRSLMLSYVLCVDLLQMEFLDHRVNLLPNTF